MPSQDPLRRLLTNPAIGHLLRVIDAFRILDPEMPLQCLMSFLYIASHDNCHKMAMEEDLEMTTATASRNTDRLSHHHRLRKPGLGLIEKYDDPTNRRRSVLRLTPRGRQFANQLREALERDY